MRRNSGKDDDLPSSGSRLVGNVETKDAGAVQLKTPAQRPFPAFPPCPPTLLPAHSSHVYVYKLIAVLPLENGANSRILDPTFGGFKGKPLDLPRLLHSLTVLFN